MFKLSLIESAFLGILQGLTEFLPISSSGQLIIAEHFLGLDVSSTKTFDIILHSGSLVALLVLFKKEVFEIFSFLLFQKSSESKNGKKILILLFIGSLPAIFVGLFFEDYLNENFRNINTVTVLLIITGVIFILAEKFVKQKKGKEINKKSAFIVGIFQAFAILPGFSRSGLTISGGLFQGIERQKAAKFSFLLAMPIIFGASLVSTLRLIFKSSTIEICPFNFIIGFAFSVLVSYFTAKYLLVIFKKVSLSIFSVFLFIEVFILFLIKAF